MSHKHLPWRPSPAAKPAFLASTASSPQSLAAVQGATSAFASRPATTTNTVKQLRNQYETTSASSQPERRRGRSPGKHNETATVTYTPQRSPSRGRHLSPEDAFVAGARSAVSSSNSSPPPSAPLAQASSVIAARLASTSPSPKRDQDRVSPPKRTDLPHEIRRADSARPAAITASVRSAAPSSRSSQSNIQSTKSSSPAVNVDFDNLPQLLPTSPVPIPGRQAHASELIENSLQVYEPKFLSSTPRMARTMSDRPRPSSQDSRGSLGSLAQPRPIRPRPPPPAPRSRGETPHSPLQQSPISTQQLQGLTRDEIINRMADAMVASSLASARTPSPSKQSRHHLGRRRSVSAHHPPRKPAVDETKLSSHYKAPRAMKQTLRKSSPEHEDDGVEVIKRGRRHLMRKHPNMHHEGDRKRWRDKVTEAERKRYEGVFAANRGLLLIPVGRKASPSRLADPNSECNQVLNVIVRDIWERSRLPGSILEQIYDLVAPEEPMYLNREQFVVGLWLIDQKLKGRKLPVRVSESVWASVRHSHGIRVSSKTMQ